jgi:CCR4-NOT transcription complex subunit 3
VPVVAANKWVPAVQICEKEMKTKAFSKEGLGQSAKQDPRERARAEIRDWLNTTVDTLNLQVGC